MISDPSPEHRAVLALDLGTTTGWALRLPDLSVTHGFICFKPQRFEGGGMRYLRFGVGWMRYWPQQRARAIQRLWVPFISKRCADTLAWMLRTSTAVCWLH